MMSHHPRVSDEQPKAENPKGLSPQGASAAASAETPHPSPVDYTEVVERLRREAAFSEEIGPDNTDVIVMRQAAQVIEAQAAEIEDLYRQVTDLKVEKAGAAIDKVLDRARIAELEKERDEANGCLLELKRHLKAEGCTYREDEEGAPYVVNTRAETAESRLSDAVKVIEDLMETGFNVAETPARQRARSFLSTGGDA